MCVNRSPRNTAVALFLLDPGNLILPTDKIKISLRFPHAPTQVGALEHQHKSAFRRSCVSVPSEGIEPPSQAPQARILSIELRGQ